MPLRIIHTQKYESFIQKNLNTPEIIKVTEATINTSTDLPHYQTSRRS